MNQQPSTHLSDEALNNLLIDGLRNGLQDDTASAEARRHLAACEPCRGRLDDFRSGIDLFNRTALAWSEARLAPIPRQAFLERPRRFAPRPLLWSTAAAALLVAALGSWNYGHRSLPLATPSPAAEARDSQAQIAEDNQLLHNVFTVLDEEPQPLREFSLNEGAASAGTHTNTRTQ